MGMLNPTQQRYVVSQDDSNCSIRYDCDSFILDPANANWCGLFGHNLATQGAGFEISLGVDTTDNGDANTYPQMGTITNIINANPNGTDNEVVTPDYDGFSIAEVSGADYPISDIKKNHLEFRNIPNSGLQLKFGAWCIGNYYDMPHSPDLSLKLSYEYDGIKTQQTKGGATLSNALYSKPADWGDYGCWQLGNQANLRSGRRVWDLSFSYLSDSDVFPVNASSGYASGGSADDFDSTILDGTDFFSQVWNKTMGGHLPFIFQPDNTNNNPDQFAICRFDQSSLQVTQQAPFLNQISLKIRESW